MLKVAVWTGIHRGGLIPHCLYAGAPGSPAYDWMVKMGVRIIHHDPLWANALAEVASRNGATDLNMKHSHLYASREAIIGTWQRIDIPIVAGLPFEHVLFTDSDVVFRRRVRLIDFGSPLPNCLAMGTEMVEAPPFNAGVMLLRLPCLRVTYAAFLDFILGNKHGLFFPNFGPQDQGALNEFYKARIAVLPKILNAKPYHVEEPNAAIIHFHGPKPSHYVAFLETGVCPLNFGSLCALGHAHAGHAYIHLYNRALEEIMEMAAMEGAPVVTAEGADTAH